QAGLAPLPHQRRRSQPRQRRPQQHHLGLRHARSIGSQDDRLMMTGAIPVSWTGMRGPLLAGPIGSSAMLERVCSIAGERAPALVLSALWLAERLATRLPVTVLIEADKRRGARRAVRRAVKDGQRL